MTRHTTRTPQRQPCNIRLGFRIVEQHDHGRLLLASDHPHDWSSGREGAIGVEVWAPRTDQKQAAAHLDQEGPNASKLAPSRG